MTEEKQVEAARLALEEAILQVEEPISMKERLDRLLRTVMTVFELDRTHIFFADSEGQMLRAAASRGAEEPLEAIRVPISREGGAIAQAFRSRQMVVWSGPDPVPEPLRCAPPYNQIAALPSSVFVVAPLVIHDRIIGVLVGDREHSRQPLDPALPQRLRPFVALVALAIESHRLYADSQTPVTQQSLENRAVKILALVEDALSGTLTLNDTLDQALDATIQTLQMEAGEIFLLDATQCVLRKIRHRGQDPDIFAERCCFALGEGIPGRVAQSGECIVIPDLVSDRRFLRPQVVEAGFRTFAAFPLKAQGRIIGCLTAAGRQPHTVTEADLQLLTALEATIGLALTNSRLLEDLQLTMSQLETKIEEIQQAHTALVEGERLRAMVQLASGVAHDFNSAMMTLLSRTQSTLPELPQDTVLKDQLLRGSERQNWAALHTDSEAQKIRADACPLRVLVIDNMRPIAETLALVLNVMGHDAVAVADGEAGLALLTAGRFDLVITDLIMSGMSGYDVASAVKARWPGLPVILITGLAEEVDHTYAGVVDRVLTKPITKAQLQQAIAQIWPACEARRSSSG